MYINIMEKNYYKFKKYKQKYLNLKKNSNDIMLFNNILNKNNYKFNDFNKYNNKYKLKKINLSEDNSNFNSSNELDGFLSIKNNELMIGIKDDNKKIILGKVYNSEDNNEIEFYNDVYKKSSNYKKYNNIFIKMNRLIENEDKFMLIYELDKAKDIFSIKFTKNKLGFDLNCSKKIEITKDKERVNKFNKIFKLLQNSYSNIKFSGGGIIDQELFVVLKSLFEKYNINQVKNIIQKIENIWSGFIFDNYINMIFIVDNINLSDPFVYKDNNRYMKLFNKDVDSEDLNTIVKLDNFDNIDIITHKNKKDLNSEQLNKLKDNVNYYTFGFLNLLFSIKSYYVIISNEEINLDEYARKFRIYHKDDTKSFHNYYKQLL